LLDLLEGVGLAMSLQEAKERAGHEAPAKIT